MKGPEKIIKTLFRHQSKDIRSYNSCLSCKYFEQKAYIIPGFSGREAEGWRYSCNHQEVQFVMRDNLLLISRYYNLGTTKVETPRSKSSGIKKCPSLLAPTKAKNKVDLLF